jgi:hypothetical protein
MKWGVRNLSHHSWVLINPCTEDTIDDGYSGSLDHAKYVLDFIRALNPALKYEIQLYTGKRN